MDSQTVQSKYVVFENDSYIIKTEEVTTKPGANQVVVKMAYSTCNPYDKICFNVFKDNGFRLGGEGCGTVIAIGEGVDASLLNKKVALTTAGCWSQYRVFDLIEVHLMLLDDSIDLKKAAAASINPLTAIGQLDMIREKGTKAFVANAAASNLNRQLLLLT